MPFVNAFFSLRIEDCMIRFPNKSLNFFDTLSCGQVFRYEVVGDGFFVVSEDKLCRCRYDGDEAIIEGDDKYFENYFDLSTDYSRIISAIQSRGFEKSSLATAAYSGVRILRQSKYEALISFIISQNNNIPRIRSTIEKTCDLLGEKKELFGREYSSFPTVEKLALVDEKTLKGLGYGYRSEYVLGAARAICEGKIDLERLDSLPSDRLKEELLSVKGIGNKVADCVILFGFHRSDVFPVDTWIEKLYRDDFNGKSTDRKKISEFFVSAFGEYSGYAQQYLFYAKRNGLF